MEANTMDWGRGGDTVLEYPAIEGIGPASKRRPQPKSGKWPPGTVIVSADSHMLETDMWYDKFPAHLRDRAPRMIFENGGWDLKFGDESAGSPLPNKPMCELTECVPGFSSIEARLADLDMMGVEKEMLFPQRLFSRNMAGDIDLREYVFPIYNEHMAEACAEAPGRLYFNALPNWWDLRESRASIEHAKALGARGIVMPCNGRKDIHGDQVIWGHPKMEPFWRAIEESGLPAVFHIGEGLPNPYPGAPLALALTNQTSFAPTWAELVFGGVFDRHPGLQVAFIEAGIGWVPKTIHDADFIYNTYQPVSDFRPKHHPSWYWYNHCYASFTVDPVGLKLIDQIGVTRCLFATDYPHAESALGFEQEVIQAVFDATESVADAQRVLGGNAIELFRLD